MPKDSGDGKKSIVISGHAITHRNFGKRNILNKIQNSYSLNKYGAEDNKDSEELISKIDETEEKEYPLRKQITTNPSVFKQQELKKNNYLAMKNRNVTNWWQQKKQEEESDDSGESFFDQNKSFTSFKHTHKAKTYVSITDGNDLTKNYTFISAIGLGSYATVNKVRKKGEDNIYVEKSINIESIKHKLLRFFGDCSESYLEEIAIALCENEVEVSNIVGLHPNISKIEESFYDKSKKEYHMYSLYAKYGTLLSSSHKKFISKENGESEKLSEIQVKYIFSEVVQGIKHSKIQFITSA